MENYNVYEDIAGRCGGDIYIGVVGPVRTGKSTFIKRFMQQLVIPRTAGEKRTRMQDELPQSAAGKTIMTTEPKFVPAQAAKIEVGEGSFAAVRLIDCVGFLVDGAVGFEEEGAPRLVNTPWSETPMPFEKAAALGTEKVIREHSTIGILVTTDGSIAEIPRENYIAAEERTVNELKEIGKPFIILLNCKTPNSEQAQQLKLELEEKYKTCVLAVNCEEMDTDGLNNVLKSILFEFPVTGIDVNIPSWMQALSAENSIISEIRDILHTVSPKISKMKDCKILDSAFDQSETLLPPMSMSLDLGTGKAEFELTAKDGVFYKVLSEECGEDLSDDLHLLSYVKSLAKSKHKFDHIRQGFEEAETNGYGMVAPLEGEMSLQEPKMIRLGSGYGVSLKASAPTYHIIKAEITGEVNPIIGTRQQSEDFMGSILSDYQTNEDNVWDVNIFGKSLRELVDAELEGKLRSMSDNSRRKMRRIVTRVVNEGKNMVICLLL